jgi:hypothetical protein
MVNGTVLLVPFGVVTVTLRVPVAAESAIVTLAVSDVELATVTEPIVMPPPLIVTLVEPATKLLPVRVSVTVEPAAAVGGLILASVVPCVTMLNAAELLVPPEVEAVRERAPAAAVGSRTSVAVICWVETMLMEVTVTPAPLTATVVPPETKFAPVIVVVTVVPGAAEFGSTDVIAGACGITLNVAGELVPALDVTVIVRGPDAASVEKLTMADSVATSVMLTDNTDTPAPLTASVVPGVVKFVPLTARVIVVPATAFAGLTEEIVGRALALSTSE